MITNAILRKDRFILQTSASRDAGLLKAGLAGKSPSINIAPYGKSINLIVNGNDLQLTKPEYEAFAYEEIRCVVKKINLFGKLDKRQLGGILDSARRTLEARLTLFFPNVVGPDIELAFAYNWASFSFDSGKFIDVMHDFHELVGEKMGPTAKVLGNNTDTISINNYSMFGILLERQILEEIAKIFVKYKILKEDLQDSFVVKAFACMFTSVLFMEAHQLMDEPDEAQHTTQSIMEEDILGQGHMLKPLFDVANVMRQEGSLESLSENHLAMLHRISENPSTIDDFTYSRVVKEQITALAKGFGGDAREFLKQKGVAVS